MAVIPRDHMGRHETVLAHSSRDQRLKSVVDSRLPYLELAELCACFIDETRLTNDDEGMGLVGSEGSNALLESKMSLSFTCSIISFFAFITLDIRLHYFSCTSITIYLCCCFWSHAGCSTGCTGWGWWPDVLAAAAAAAVNRTYFTSSLRKLSILSSFFYSPCLARRKTT